MILTSYINDLLYRYDCVIVPNFGGFVSNIVSAKVNHFSHTFYPPTKQITFNSHLKNNDGLLANHIAVQEHISFEKATEFITTTVANWNAQVQKESITLDNIGSFSLNAKNQLVFEPITSCNYFTETFGMSAVNSPAIKRLAYQKEAEKVLPITAKKSSNFLKYAATAAILLTVGAFGWKNYENNQLEKNYAKQQKAVENKIQSAAFVIDNPLPTIQLNLEKPIAKNFHVIAGAFQFPENAEKKLTLLKKKGFDAEIIGVNEHGLTQVTFSSYATRSEAVKNLENIQKTFSSDAWLLIKKLD